MLNMMYGANIPYPYDSVPNLSLPDGTPGIWTLIGAAEQVSEDLKENTGDGTGKPKKVIDSGPRREDEK